MTQPLNLTVTAVDGSTSPLQFSVGRVFNAAWSARNAEERDRHIDELQRAGVPAPARTPDCFELSPDRVQATKIVHTLSPGTSGEAEYVILVGTDDIYVGVGSDHTDRQLEASSVRLAKQLYPNVLGTSVWPLGDIDEHWEQLLLESDVHNDGAAVPYQRGSVDLLMPPSYWLAELEKCGIKVAPGLILFSGTISVIGDLTNATLFSGRLTDPIAERTLSIEYEIVELSTSIYQDDDSTILGET